MQKLIIFFLLILFPTLSFGKEMPDCKEPKNLKELGQTLANETSTLRTIPAEEHNIDYNNLLVSKKYLEMIFIIDKYFPKDYRKAVDDYLRNFEKLDLIYRQAIIEKNGEIKDIKPKWDFHYYVLTDVFPVLLNSRFFTPTRRLSADPALEEKGKKFWDTMSKADFSPENLQICRDEKERERQKDLTQDLADLRGEVANKPYKQILENPTVNQYSTEFDPDYENLTTILELKLNNGTLDEKSFYTDPTAASVKDEKIGPMEGLFSFLDKFKNYFIKDLEEDNKTNTNNLFKNFEYITAREKTLNIQQRYMQWRNNRNFWMQKTNQVTGYNLDVSVEKFEIMLDAILRTNKELTDSLKAVQKICQSQNVKINCWQTGNTIPNHKNTPPGEYKKRTAENDN